MNDSLDFDALGMSTDAMMLGTTVTIHRNGDMRGAKQLHVPSHWTHLEFLNAASQRLNLVPPADRVFNADGVLIDDTSYGVDDGDVLFLSQGKSFKDPRRRLKAIKDASGGGGGDDGGAGAGVVDGDGSGGGGGTGTGSGSGGDALIGAPTVGGYVLGPGLGEGGFGLVRQGRHSVTGDVVALKFLRKSRMGSATAVGRVVTEIQCLSELQHPHVIRLVSVFNEPSTVVLALEYASGGDLRGLLESRKPDGRLPESEARALFKQTVSGVSYAHKHHICHHDLKLENLLLTGDHKTVKITDFGLSRFCKPGELHRSSAGSLAYLPPEVVRGSSNAGPPIDVWALGVILYALLFGRLPFRSRLPSTASERDRESDIRQRIQRCDYKFPDSIAVSVEARDLIRQMLHVNPDARITVPGIYAHPWLSTATAPHLLLSASTTPRSTASDASFTYSPARAQRRSRYHPQRDVVAAGATAPTPAVVAVPAAAAPSSLAQAPATAPLTAVLAAPSDPAPHHSAAALAAGEVIVAATSTAPARASRTSVGSRADEELEAGSDGGLVGGISAKGSGNGHGHGGSGSSTAATSAMYMVGQSSTTGSVAAHHRPRPGSSVGVRGTRSAAHHTQGVVGPRGASLLRMARHSTAAVLENAHARRAGATSAHVHSRRRRRQSGDPRAIAPSGSGGSVSTSSTPSPRPLDGTVGAAPYQPPSLVGRRARSSTPAALGGVRPGASLRPSHSTGPAPGSRLGGRTTPITSLSERSALRPSASVGARGSGAAGGEVVGFSLYGSHARRGGSLAKAGRRAMCGPSGAPPPPQQQQQQQQQAPQAQPQAPQPQPQVAQKQVQGGGSTASSVVPPSRTAGSGLRRSNASGAGPAFGRRKRVPATPNGEGSPRGVAYGHVAGTSSMVSRPGGAAGGTSTSEESGAHAASGTPPRRQGSRRRGVATSPILIPSSATAAPSTATTSASPIVAPAMLLPPSATVAAAAATATAIAPTSRRRLRRRSMLLDDEQADVVPSQRAAAASVASTASAASSRRGSESSMANHADASAAAAAMNATPTSTAGVAVSVAGTAADDDDDAAANEVGGNMPPRTSRRRGSRHGGVLSAEGDVSLDAVPVPSLSHP